MIGGMNTEPYRRFNSADEIPAHSRKVWNNPCRYMHQHNNGWLYPFYGGDAIPKWTPEEAVAGKPQPTFDLVYLHKNRVRGPFFGDRFTLFWPWFHPVFAWI